MVKKVKKLIVIGNGMAGMRTVEELLELSPDKYEITHVFADLDRIGGRQGIGATIHTWLASHALRSHGPEVTISGPLVNDHTEFHIMQTIVEDPEIMTFDDLDWSSLADVDIYEKLDPLSIQPAC